MSTVVREYPWKPPWAVGWRERWLCDATPVSTGSSTGAVETSKAGYSEPNQSQSTAPGVHANLTSLPDPSLWFPSADSPFLVDLFGIPLADASLYAQCNQCTTSTPVFCEGSRVAFPAGGEDSGACGACCRCMAVFVRRAQWLLIAEELTPGISSALYTVTTSNHHMRGSKAASLERDSAGVKGSSQLANPAGDTPRSVPITQSEVPYSTSNAVWPQKKGSGSLASQAHSVSSQQYSDGENKGTRELPQRHEVRDREVRDKEMRLAAEQRSVLPFVFYVFPKLWNGDCLVMRDVWRYLEFSAARTRPLLLWKDCERCRARHVSEFASFGKTAEALEEFSASRLFPEKEEEKWWRLAYMGPGGLCGCPQNAEWEAAELERREGESAVAYRERMYLLALQRWTMGNEVKAMADALAKITENSPEDFCAVLLATKFLLLGGDRHGALRLCTRPKVVEALGHLPFFWSLLAFAADQSGLPHILRETLAYRAARLAVTLDPNDVHAHHTLLHIFHAEGYLTDSLLLTWEFHPAWARCKSFLRHHVWWHVAVVLADMHQFHVAMQLFWRQVYSPEKQKGWDSHSGAMQLLLRLKILHGWSVEFWRHHKLRMSKVGDCRTAGRTDEEGKHKGQQVELGEDMVTTAGDFEHELMSALRQVLLRVRLEEDEKTRPTLQKYGCSGSGGEEPYNSLSPVDSATLGAPAAFYRGTWTGGLSISCYIAALALTTRTHRVSRSPFPGIPTPLRDKSSESSVDVGRGRTDGQGHQSWWCGAETNRADEELRKLEQEVVPYLGWKARNYGGQVWVPVGKAFKAWADGDYATSARLLQPLLRQDLAVRAAREEVQHSRICVTQAERGNSTLQTQRELVNEAVFAARDAELQEEIQGRGLTDGSPSSCSSCLELLFASREQAELVTLIFLDAFYHSRKRGLLGGRDTIGEGVSLDAEGDNIDIIEATASKLLNTKLATEARATAPLLHVYLFLFNTVCASKSDSRLLAVDTEMHRKTACDLIEKYAEGGNFCEGLVRLT